MGTVPVAGRLAAVVHSHLAEEAKRIASRCALLLCPPRRGADSALTPLVLS